MDEGDDSDTKTLTIKLVMPRDQGLQLPEQQLYVARPDPRRRPGAPGAAPPPAAAA